MTQHLSPAAARPRGRWRSILATLALVGALFAAGAAAPANAEVVGEGPGAISGSVTSDGLGLSSIYVNVYSTQGAIWSAYTSTDADGHYEFTGLSLGTYSVSTNVSGYQQVPQQNASLTDASLTVNANFAVMPFEVGVGTINGHVTGDGVALPNWEITVQNQATNQVFWMNADQNGYFSFSGLSIGDWYVNPAPSSGQYQFLPQLVAHLSAAAPSAVVDVAFVSYPVGTSAITGVFADSATGAPISGVNVSAYGVDVLHQSNTSSDATGAFSFNNLPAGTYFLSYGSVGYLHASVEVHALADQTVTVDRALVAANATISGHVVGPDGAPVAGLYVDAHTQDGNIGGASTDENGNYLLSDLGAVPYTLTIGGGLYTQQQRVVAPVANGDVIADFSLEYRTTGSLGGWVLLPNGEYYNKPVCATLYSSKTKKPLGESVTIGEDFGDGSYGFFDLKPGKYTVGFRDCDDDPSTKFDKVFLGGVKNFKDATILTVVAGQDSWENNVTLTPRKN